jgi:hypothetical protein
VHSKQIIKLGFTLLRRCRRYLNGKLFLLRVTPSNLPLKLTQSIKGATSVDDNADIAGRMSDALNAAMQCSAAETVENYSHLAAQLQELDALAGQTLRSHTVYLPILTKLQQGASLTSDELTALRSLIVGDADEYLKYDDDFEQAKTELTKVLDEIRGLTSADADLEALKHLRVLCREASSALGPVMQYLEQKERVRNFEEHTRGPLSPDAARILAGIVRNMAA